MMKIGDKFVLNNVEWMILESVERSKTYVCIARDSVCAAIGENYKGVLCDSDVGQALLKWAKDNIPSEFHMYVQGTPSQDVAGYSAVFSGSAKVTTLTYDLVRRHRGILTDFFGDQCRLATITPWVIKNNYTRVKLFDGDIEREFATVKHPYHPIVTFNADEIDRYLADVEEKRKTVDDLALEVMEKYIAAQVPFKVDYDDCGVARITAKVKVQGAEG